MKYIYYIDAGVEHLHLRKYEIGQAEILLEKTIKVDDTIENVFRRENLWQEMFETAENEIFASGKLAAIVIKVLGKGREIVPAAAIWSAADYLFSIDKQESIGIIDLSASGYMAISVDANGSLIKDNLVVNPRCGAGSGTNLSRILHKLDIRKDKVDEILKKFIGEAGKEERSKISVRADRCGVFSSSATVSDKNQGIPLENALAVTLKSEVLKAVKKLAHNVETVYLTGRVFNWQFARDCAQDYLESQGVKKVLFDEKQVLILDGIKYLSEKVGLENFKTQEQHKISKEEAMIEYPAFSKLFAGYSKKDLYLREANQPIELGEGLTIRPVAIGLDIGSTMAKIVIADVETHDPLYLASFDNHGDTIETVKHIFRTLKEAGIESLNLQQVGITGSGRYQVQKILGETYPHLKERIHVLVENYAHARGSLKEAKERIKLLKEKGKEVNEDFCLLVDVGGEDTKVSVVSLKDEDLYDNAMNIKCSAGTGSLMDTLSSMFSIPSVKVACEKAMTADKAYGINATCAVFLIENARKLQAQGYEQKEILASCYWAIVENMARTLWSQIDFPKNALTLLHGQTMLSDPLPLAITHRLQEYTGSDTTAYVPPHPGHRACFGLIKGLPRQEMTSESCQLSRFIERQFVKQIFVCRGAACGDKNSCCTRSMLTYTDQDGAKKFIPLGGCTSVNEKEARLQQGAEKIETARKDVYKEIWTLLDSALKKSDKADRLVMPRSFAGSEQAFFFQQIFSYFNIPVHVDNVRASDVIEAQPRISIDTCAPVIGAIGQFSRLAQEQHGLIFIPQIDYLPTNRKSLGRTCTTNQGGVVIAINMAKEKNPQANFFMADISLAKKNDKQQLAKALLSKLENLFKFYGKEVNQDQMEEAIAEALKQEQTLKDAVCDHAAKEITSAVAAGKKVVVISGREYILNPGIYDSHAGRLFSDKGVVAIPSFIFNGELHDDYAPVYWRNPHHILSIIDAVSKKQLHRMSSHQGLADALAELENNQQKSQPIGVIYVSTFRCGPDSMILQTAQELAKEMPFLIIQSDAAINELAHLENRVNTYLGQLSASNDGKNQGLDFKIEFLEKFSAKKLDKDRDVIYFPTLEDNRPLTAVFRSSGYYCIDIYDDETYNLQKIIKYGRRFTGDAVCAPFAAVFADTLIAVADYVKRVKSGEIKDRTNIVVFNNKGTGPCRQGQYYEMHRLLLHRELSAFFKGLSVESLPVKNITVQYIVGHEDRHYNIGLEPWALLEAFQSVVMQGILHSTYFEASRACNNLSEYQVYREDYLALKQKVFNIFENIKPSPLGEKIIKATAGVPGLNFLSLYFFTGVRNNNGLRNVLKDFSGKWKLKEAPRRGLKIYAEGEAYMRVAQIEEVYKQLVDNLGIDAFEFSYSPIWLYAEYLLENKILVAKEKQKLRFSFKNWLEIYTNKFYIKIFRLILVRPLYRAASLSIPATMSQVLKRAKKVLPTNKPYGELAPYVGEALLKLDSGTELFLNIAPEGCMVATMGDMLTKAIYGQSNKKANARIQGLFSTDGEINSDKLVLALMKILKPQGYYRKN